jgi:hydrogenase maturation protease
VRILLIGCGNPLRGDDGAAWRVVEELAMRWGDRIQVRLGQQLVPEWAADLADADVAFIVDASAVSHARLSRLDTPTDTRVDGHVFTPQHLLALTDQVYGRSAVTYLVEVPATDFNFGQELSSATTVAIREAVELVHQSLVRTSMLSSASSPLVGSNATAAPSTAVPRPSAATSSSTPSSVT